MNNTIEEFTRTRIKELLEHCTDKQRDMFCRMYAPKDNNLTIDEVVDNLPESKLDWALSQCENTININKDQTK